MRRLLAIAIALALPAVAACDPAPAPGADGPRAAAALAERTGVIARGDKPLTLLGPDLQVGDTAPDFELTGPDMSPIRSADLRGKVVVLSVVPSLDTPVCEKQTGNLASREKSLPQGAVLLTVSRDLPFAQRRFLETSKLECKLASDYREASFGTAWGLLVKESRLLARSVWVIDRQGKIAYREIVADQTREPSYDPAMEAAARVAAAP